MHADTWIKKYHIIVRAVCASWLETLADIGAFFFFLNVIISSRGVVHIKYYLCTGHANHMLVMLSVWDVWERKVILFCVGGFHSAAQKLVGFCLKKLLTPPARVDFIRDLLLLIFQINPVLRSLFSDFCRWGWARRGRDVLNRLTAAYFMAGSLVEPWAVVCGCSS